jgi:TonB family protein
VQEGEETFLNTSEWKYASFFNRVKQAVGTHWDPNSPLRQRDPTGQIYGGRDRYTLLSITLDAQGALREVHVEKSSGVDFLDEAAIAAFQKSQPFPNPPPGLLEKDNAIHFQFGFFMEFGGGPRMRLFRNN